MPRARNATMDDIDELRLALSAEMSHLRDDLKKQQEEIQTLQLLVETQRRDHDKLKNECRRMDVRISDVQKDLEASVAANANALKAVNARIDSAFSGLHEVGDELKRSQVDVQHSVESVRKELRMVRDITDEVSVGVDVKLQATLTKAMQLHETKQREVEIFAKNFSDKMEKSYASHVAGLADTTTAVKANTEMKLAEFSERLNDEVVKANNQTTRTVEWRVFKAQETFIKNEELRLYSAPFGAAGVGVMRMELRVARFRGEVVDTSLSPADCGLFLWAPKGVTLVFMLHVGKGATKRSQRYEHTFHANLSAFGGLAFQASEFIDYSDDSLLVAVEVLESRVHVDFLDTLKTNLIDFTVPEEVDELLLREEKEPDFLNRVPEPPMKLTCTKYQSHRVLDQVKRYVDEMKSRNCRRVEWIIKNASSLPFAYQQGKPLQSSPVSLAGIEGLCLLFYPSGYFNSPQGFCSLYLSAPAGTSIKGELFAVPGDNTSATVRRKIQYEFTQDERGAFGRANFCAFEQIVDLNTDTITLGFDLAEAFQTLTGPGSIIPSSILKVQRHAHTGLLTDVRQIQQ